MTGEIRRTGEHIAYENSFVRVYDDEVEFGDGSAGRYVRIVNKPEEHEGVVVLARCDGRFALVRTHRYPVGDFQWALPRGFAHGADVLASARAEVLEELGADLVEGRVLGRVTPDSGLMAARVAVVLADVAEPSTTPRDQVEVQAVRWVTADELEDLIRTGQVEDGFTLAGWTLFTLQR